MLIKAGKVFIKNLIGWRYHYLYKYDAIRILKKIESVNGKTDPKHIKLSYEYAVDVLGCNDFAPWLYVYTAIAKTFKEGWIPGYYYGKIVVPKIAGDYGKIASLKSLTSRLFKSTFFPDQFYFSNGLWFSTEYHILSEKEVKKNAFEETEKVVFKIDNSLQGHGVFIIEKDNFSKQNYKLLGNGVLQKYINQHAFFKEIMPNSVATLRVTSVIDDTGTASARACYLRVGRSSDSHVKSSSHIRIPVNIDTGQLYKYGYTVDWIQIEKHPDSNFIFDNKQIPNFNMCIEAAINLHKLVPFARIIGWDMIIDNENNIRIMEWNGFHTDIVFSEATQGPCFSDLGWDKLWRSNLMLTLP